MANVNRKSNRASKIAPVAAPVVTVADITTIDDMVAFVRSHVTIASFVAFVASIRATFPMNVHRRNVGRLTNRRIVDFQNWTYDRNTSWELADEQLAALWIAEFPSAVGAVFVGHPADVIAIIRSVRAQFNTGKHANADRVPTVASVAYGDSARMKPAAMFPRAAAPAPVAPAAPVAAPAPAPVAKPAGRLRRSA